MDTVKITFNDGSVHEYPKGTSYYEISKDANIENIVAFKIGNTVNTLEADGDNLVLFSSKTKLGKTEIQNEIEEIVFGKEE